jgi:hypothetical protein
VYGEKVMVTMEVNEPYPLKMAASIKLEQYQRDWSVQRWAEHLASTGNVPFNMLDEETMHQLVYGWYVVEQYKLALQKARKTNPEVKGENIEVAGLPPLGTVRTEPNVGPPAGTGAKTWGIAAPEQAPAPPKLNPLLESTKLSNIKANNEGKMEALGAVQDALPTKEELREQAHENSLVSQGAAPATPETHRTHLKELEDLTASAGNPQEQRWKIATLLARKPDAEIMPTLEADGEMMLLVGYIRNWFRETQTMPDMPSDFSFVYWPNAAKDDSDQANERRESMLGRINKFTGKHGITFDPAVDRANIKENSYRITMAAIALEQVVEEYATAYRRNDYATNAEAIEKEIGDRGKAATVAYITAHETVETKPGPLNTLDPNYVDYIMLLRKYSLPYGTLLHEASL